MVERHLAKVAVVGSNPIARSILFPPVLLGFLPYFPHFSPLPAIFGALWLADKGPGLYSMEQIVADMVGRNVPIF